MRSTLIAGLHRATRHSSAATRRIPPETLLTYLASQPAWQHRDRLLPVESPDRSEAVRLTASDPAIAGAYTRHGADQLPTAELVRALAAAGLATRSAHTLISLSPLLRQVGLGVQQLRGSQPRS